ncbi:MAG: outer membrane beta-barrel protein [Bacteroidales bacterium]|nr:outer membrane beta-barrel protein [Bacteroidales bacterium]
MKHNTNILLKKTIFFLGLIVFSIHTFAQRIEPNRWIIKADGGASVFFGDVKRYDIMPDHESPSEIQPMFSVSVGKEISKIFSVRGQFISGKLSGHKKSSKYNFKSNILGGHLLTDINLYYLFTGERFGPNRFNIYASIGVGYTSWDTKLYYDKAQLWGSDIASTNSNGAFSIPASMSMEYVINKNFAVNAEGLLSVVTSDAVDAVLGGIEFDSYVYASLGVVYKFNIKLKKKKSRIKYSLDPELYEAKPEDLPYLEKEDVAVAAVVEAETVPDKRQESVKEDKPREEFEINHSIENAAIQKEIWADRGEDPWPGIEFSVQVLASKNRIDIDRIKKEIGLDEHIYERYDDIWYRYNMGRFHKVWKAKDLRNILRSKHGVEDAFIVVYRGEERISLAEAMNYAIREQQLGGPKNGDVSPYVASAAEQVYPMISLKSSIPTAGITIGVQVLSIQNNKYPIGMFSGIYGIDNPILVSEKLPWYKIIVGGFSTYEEALEFIPSAREKGFIEAFVVAYKDGKRISIKKLKAELGE